MQNQLTNLADLFTENLATVLSMYNRGQFEFSVAQEPDTARLIYDRRNRFVSENVDGWVPLRKAASHVFEAALKIAPDVGKLRKYADQELYRNGRIMPWRSRGGFENLLKSVFRARAINYEILDYYLQNDKQQSEYLIEVARGLHRNDCRDYIRELFQRTFGFEGESGLITTVCEEVVLLGLCGINELYRRHSPKDTRRGLTYLKSIQRFINEDLKALKGNRLSHGLLGLAQYLQARLHFDLGEQKLALEAAVASSDTYALKGLRQARARQMNRERYTAAELEESQMIALRRSALSTAMGVAHIQIVSGNINEALNILNLSRLALANGCGEIYARYVDLLWAEGYRALHSSSRKDLLRVVRVLLRSHRAFKRLSKDSHLIKNSNYERRSNVELALAYYYQARYFTKKLEKPEKSDDQTIWARRKQQCLDNALRYCEAAIQPVSETNKPQRKNRLESEAYIVRSRLHLLNGAKSDFKAAVADAVKAVDCAGENPRHRCEALIALGTAYLQEADAYKNTNTIGYTVSMLALARKATEALKEALEVHKENRRLTALCLLRLAQVSMLTPKTYPDVAFYLRQYADLESHVEYAFVKHVAEEVRSKAGELDTFCVVARDEWNTRNIGANLEDYFVREFINALAEDIDGALPDGKRRTITLKKKDSGISLYTPRRRGRPPTLLSWLAKNIETNLHLPKKKAEAAAKEYLSTFQQQCSLIRNQRRLTGKVNSGSHSD